LPTADTAGEENITLPAVVHGPILVSFPDLNGFEYGSKLINPYQSLFERKPNAVIADGIAVFYGDYALPRAAAIQYEVQVDDDLQSHPQAALSAARQAVALVPDGFSANLSLGDALAATGNKSAARAAYLVDIARIPEMEPTSREKWKPALAKRIASVQ
jgi:hypothetical protein